MVAYVVGVAPLNEVDDVFLAEVFLHGFHGSKHHREFLSGFNLLVRMQTVVAVSAVVPVVFLTEIMEQHLAAADR